MGSESSTVRSQTVRALKALRSALRAEDDGNAEEHRTSRCPDHVGDPGSTGRGTLMRPQTSDDPQTRTMTLEAFADTIVPGEKRWPDDRAIAGVRDRRRRGRGRRARAAGVPGAAGCRRRWCGLAGMLNGHAQSYAGRARRSTLDDDGAALRRAAASTDRTALVQRADRAGPPGEGSCGSAWRCSATWPSTPRAHLHTADALAAGPPGPD